MVGKLIKADGEVGRGFLDFFLQDVVDEVGHIELSFGSVVEMTASQSFIL